MAHKVLEIEGCDRYRAPIINEGGAIHVDGQGTALVTEQCLLNPNRNAELSREQIEDHLKSYLGVQAVSFTYARTEWKILDEAVRADFDYLKTVARRGPGWSD